MLLELNYTKTLHKKKDETKKRQCKVLQKKEVSSTRIETDTQASFVERFTDFATDIVEQLGEFVHYLEKKAIRQALVTMIT